MVVKVSDRIARGRVDNDARRERSSEGDHQVLFNFRQETTIIKYSTKK